MRSATIRQVRHDLGSVLAWVEAGEEVTITRRNQPVARLCPLPPKKPKKFKMPDFEARRRAIFGDAPPTTNVILDEREKSRW